MAKDTKKGELKTLSIKELSNLIDATITANKTEMKIDGKDVSVDDAIKTLQAMQKAK